MQNKGLVILCIFFLIALSSCSQNTPSSENKNEDKSAEKESIKKEKPHRYGGWYCPDNLFGFPPVDINNWENVPVVNGRMPTKEETQNGTSLIFVDTENYPDAKALDMQMPKLAKYYTRSSGKEEIIIVIQALTISNDSLVGFRYLNGGNGSARINEVTFLSNNEIKNIASSRFVRLNIDINATKDKIWGVLTGPEYYTTLQAIFDKENSLKRDYNNVPKVNFKYLNAGTTTSEFAGDLYGNKYIQIDSELDDYQYVEKFLLGENEKTKKPELIIVCGPYGVDFEKQKNILEEWSQKVKELSEEE